MLNILATAHGERITWEKNGEQHHGLPRDFHGSFGFGGRARR